MKLFDSTRQGVAVLAFISLGLLMLGCKKEEITYENFEASNLRVVNGYPGQTSVKFYLDTFNLTYTGTVNYNVSTPYYVVKIGSRRAAFYSTTAKDTFAKADIQLASKKIYTLFLTSTAKTILTEDDLTQPAADKARIRLANLSGIAGNVDLAVQLQDAGSGPQTKPEVSVLQNVAAETISKYTEITVPASKGNAKSNLHNVQIYQAGTKNLLATIKSTNVNPDADFRGTATYTITLNGIRKDSLVARSAMEWLTY